MRRRPTRAGMLRGAAPALALAVLCAASLALPAFASATAPSGGTGRIFFARDSNPGPPFEQDIHVVNSDGSGLRNLTPGMADSQTRPSVDPTGRWIAFASGGVDGDIWLMRSDGTGMVELLPGATSPVFSPDGEWIAFFRDTDPAPVTLESDLWVMRPDGSGLRKVTNTPGFDETDPDFSPDGRRLLFDAVVAPPGDDDVFSVGLDGKGLRPLVAGGTDDFFAFHSPDGSRIGFTRSPGNERIHVANADGSNALNLMPAWNQEALHGSFSGNGKLIVFDDDNDNLFTISSAGGPVIALQPDDTQGDAHPDWEHVFRCAGRRATIVGDDGPDRIKGTKKTDVIVTNAGKDIVRGRGGNDRICGGRGKDQLRGNNGRDRIFGQAGADLLAGGRAADTLRGGKGKDKERQ